ncbi:ROK family protein [Granulicella cerasi]|uniref:ROK family protein n=1 Tax=Granulicella cerasi TaxID=741063 RepID=A0ABW1ZCU4_9BACT|nr:ROK family protein [Granulicella cerasi]
MSTSTAFAAEPSIATGTTIGVILSQRIYAGLLEDGRLSGELKVFPATPLPDPEDEDDDMSLVELPTESIVEAICDSVLSLAKSHEAELAAIGVAIPGLVRNGVIDEAPNFPQLKGANLESRLEGALAERGIKTRVCIVNDADAMAAGLASTHGKLDSHIRVWTLGTGIGYGVYPFMKGVWEAGHTVVTLDDRENYCGCGGRGHLEGIMGQRAMRLRFLDMEPEEVFEAANRKSDPDPRCLEFKKLWHKALAAATSNALHVSGPGKFFVTGFNTRFLDTNMLRHYIGEMVKMSSLQSYSLEVVDDDQSVRVIGAAVAAMQMCGAQ